MWFNLYFKNKDALFYFLENYLNLKEGRHFSHLGSQDACQSLQSIITTTFHWAYSHQTKVYQAPLQRDEVVFHTIKRKMCKESRPHQKERETERQRETERERRNIMYMWKEREGRQQILKTKHNIFAIIYNLFWVYFVLNFSKEILLHYASQQSVMMYWNLVLWFCSGKWWNQ